MRDKLLSFGSDIFTSAELCEMLLYYSLPHKDTCDIARELMLRFGSLEAVLRAPAEELCAVSGVGTAIAEYIHDIGEFMLSRELEFHPCPRFLDYEQLGEYYIDMLSECTDYRIAVSLLNDELCLRNTVVPYLCDLSSGRVRTKDFIELCREYEASVIITAHTHPFGPLFPSVGDVATVRMLAAELYEAGILMLEGYVISGKEFIPLSPQYADYGARSEAIAEFKASVRRARNG
ncbi:MAG: hypothetical protein IIX96_03915 [Clostridia bacterium]|nr:hypothetical protein [Clostridia bacterium]